MTWSRGRVLDLIAFVGVGTLLAGGVAVAVLSSRVPSPIGQRLPTTPPGVDITASETSAGWLSAGEELYVTTFGSVSCPTVPTSLQEDEEELVINMTKQQKDTCDESSSPTSVAISLPDKYRGRVPLTIGLDVDGTRQEFVIQ